MGGFNYRRGGAHVRPRPSPVRRLRTVAAGYSMVYPGVWGSWKKWYMAPKTNYLACGMRTKSEKKQGSGDDTAANRFRFRCRQAFGRRQTGIYYPRSKTNWGHWKSSQLRGNGNRFICGSRVRFEKPVGRKDDTALNGLQLKLCRVYK